MKIHDDKCGKFDDYSLQFVKHLVHTCETSGSEAVQSYAQKIEQACDLVVM
jgi:hypothetical protein